jgi:hypothetical protein
MAPQSFSCPNCTISLILKFVNRVNGQDNSFFFKRLLIIEKDPEELRAYALTIIAENRLTLNHFLPSICLAEQSKSFRLLLNVDG